MYKDGPDTDIEPIIDGLIKMLRKNLCARTLLVQDAQAGDTEIYVDNPMLFERKETIVLGDSDSIYSPDENRFDGFEYHVVEGPCIPTGHQIRSGTKIQLKEPLQRDFLVSSGSYIKKAIKKAILNEKDVLYGDRSVIAFDMVAITVAPTGDSNEWIALQGLLNQEYKLSIMVYVKHGTSGEEQETAERLCHGYANAIKRLFLNNIHVDIDVDEVKLARDVCIGDTSVFINASEADLWPADSCSRYELQDAFKSQFFFSLIEPGSLSSSSSSSSSCDPSLSESSLSSVSSSSNSSSGSSSSSMMSDSSASSASSNSSSSSLSSLPSTSSSSDGGNVVELFLNRPASAQFRVADKAVLRRRIRYMYDSRVTDTEYGVASKGSAILKGCKLSWFGKETTNWTFPQIGKGGDAY